MPCIMNAANEIAVEAFLKDKIGFMEMPSIIEKTMNNISFKLHPSLDDYASTDCEARLYTKSLIN